MHEQKTVFSPSVSTKPLTWTDPESRRVLGEFQLGQVLGEGGYGVVHLATQTGAIRRTVAIKLIRPGLASPEVLHRFDRERAVLAAMSHRNVASIFAAGATDDGQPWFAMEYVAGDPITRFADQEGLGVRARFELFLQVCRGIHHAHQRGIIHRDLKPSNILVRYTDGRPEAVVIDFGIARASLPTAPDDVGLTGIGRIAGTPEFMSPEQMEGRNDTLDVRSDVFSLGVVLHELLAGKRPFTPTSAAAAELVRLAAQLRLERPSAPSAAYRNETAARQTVIAECRGTTPGDLSRRLRREPDWITQRALEPEPADRYESVLMLMRDVQDMLNDRPIEAGRPSVLHRLRGTVRRHRTAAALIGFVTFMLLTAIGGTTVAAARERDLRSEAESESYMLGLRSAAAATVLADVPEALDALDRAPLALRSWEWHVLRSQIDQSAAVIDELPDGVRSMSVDGEWLAVLDGVRVLRCYRYDPDSGRWTPASDPVAVETAAEAIEIDALRDGSGKTTRLRVLAGGDTALQFWNVPLGARGTPTAATEPVLIPRFKTDRRIIVEIEPGPTLGELGANNRTWAVLGEGAASTAVAYVTGKNDGTIRIAADDPSDQVARSIKGDLSRIAGLPVDAAVRDDSLVVATQSDGFFLIGDSDSTTAIIDPHPRSIQWPESVATTVDGVANGGHMIAVGLMRGAAAYVLIDASGARSSTEDGRHESEVTATAFRLPTDDDPTPVDLPDPNRVGAPLPGLITGGRDRTVRMTRTDGLGSIRLLGHLAGISRLDSGPELVVSSGPGPRVLAWPNRPEFASDLLLADESPCSGVGTSGTGGDTAELAVYVSYDRSSRSQLRIIDTLRRATVGEATIGSTGDRITAIAMTPDGQFVFAGSAAGKLHAIELESSGTGRDRRVTATSIGTITPSSSGFVYDLAIGPKQASAGSPTTVAAACNGTGGAVVATLTDDGMGYVFKVTDRLPHGGARVIRSVAAIKHGAWVTGDAGGAVRFWQDGKLRAERTLEGATTLPHHRAINSISVRPGAGSAMVHAASYGGRVHRLLVDDGSITRKPSLEVGDIISFVRIHPRSPRLIVGCDDGDLEVWDPDAGERLVNVARVRGGLSSAAFDPDGVRLVFGLRRGGMQVKSSRSVAERWLLTRD